MKVAYLITAYHQPEHLARLVHALDCPWASFYVHVDAKSDIAPFIDALKSGDSSSNPNIHILGGPHRVKCYWGGFGLVRATLNLMKASLISKSSFSRFCLLSGSDYPIQPLEAIFKALDSKVEFLSVDRQLAPKIPISHFDSRATHYHFRNPSLLRKLGLNGRIPRLRPSPLPLFVGSGWWCLTRDAVSFVLDYVCRNPDYIRWMRYFDIPDEGFIHTLVKASTLARNISDDFENCLLHDAQHVQNVYGAHYIDWHGGGFHPKVLVEDDLPKLLRSTALFARKLEEPVSNQLRDSLTSTLTST